MFFLIIFLKIKEQIIVSLPPTLLNGGDNGSFRHFGNHIVRQACCKMYNKYSFFNLA